MKHIRDIEAKNRIIKRLKRIEGQVKALQRMTEEDRECIEIMTQLSSTSAAIKGVWLEVAKGHLNTCLKNSLKDKSKYEEIVEELVFQIQKIR